MTSQMLKVFKYTAEFCKYFIMFKSLNAVTKKQEEKKKKKIFGLGTFSSPLSMGGLQMQCHNTDVGTGSEGTATPATTTEVNEGCQTQLPTSTSDTLKCLMVKCNDMLDSYQNLCKSQNNNEAKSSELSEVAKGQEQLIGELQNLVKGLCESSTQSQDRDTWSTMSDMIGKVTNIYNGLQNTTSTQACTAKKDQCCQSPAPSCKPSQLEVPSIEIEDAD